MTSTRRPVSLALTALILSLVAVSVAGLQFTSNINYTQTYLYPSLAVLSTGTGGFGNLSFVGSYSVGSVRGQPVAGLADICIEAWDNSNGQWVWTRMMGGDQTDFLHSVGVDTATGDVYGVGQVGGYADGEANIFAGQSYVGGMADALLIKYSVAGTFQWARVVGTLSGYENFVSVAVDSVRGVVYAFGTGDGADASFVLYAYDRTGNVLWSRTSIGNGNSYPESAAVNRFGDIFLSGEVAASSWDGESSNSSRTQVIQKYNSTGDRQFTRFYGPLDTGTATIEQVADDRTGAALYAVGSITGFTAYYGTAAYGNYDATLLKIDSVTGAVIWSVLVGSGGLDQYLSVAVDPSSAVYASGYTTSSGIFGFPNPSPFAGNVAFISKFSSAGVVQWIRFIHASTATAVQPTSTGFDDSTASAFVVVRTNAARQLSTGDPLTGPISTPLYRLTNRLCPLINSGFYCADLVVPEPCKYGECNSTQAIKACPTHAVCWAYGITSCTGGYSGAMCDVPPPLSSSAEMLSSSAELHSSSALLSSSAELISSSALPLSSSVLPLSSSALPLSSSALPLSSSALPLSSSALPLSSSASPVSSSAEPLSSSAQPVSSSAAAGPVSSSSAVPAAAPHSSTAVAPALFSSTAVAPGPLSSSTAGSGAGSAQSSTAVGSVARSSSAATNSGGSGGPTSTGSSPSPGTGTRRLVLHFVVDVSTPGIDWVAWRAELLHAIALQAGVPESRFEIVWIQFETAADVKVWRTNAFGRRISSHVRVLATDDGFAVVVDVQPPPAGGSGNETTADAIMAAFYRNGLGFSSILGVSVNPNAAFTCFAADGVTQISCDPAATSGGGKSNGRFSGAEMVGIVIGGMVVFAFILYCIIVRCGAAVATRNSNNKATATNNMALAGSVAGGAVDPNAPVASPAVSTSSVAIEMKPLSAATTAPPPAAADAASTATTATAATSAAVAPAGGEAQYPVPAGAVASGKDYSLPDGYFLKADGTIIDYSGAVRSQWPEFATFWANRQQAGVAAPAAANK